MPLSPREPTFRLRSVGRAWFGPAFDAVLFLRPRQWPILSFQLAVGVLVSPGCLAALTGAGAADLPSGSGPLPPPVILAAAWLAWVVCLNGGTLAFNSAHDRDVGDIAYLERPPLPSEKLNRFGLAMMLAGVGLAVWVTPTLGALTAGCVLLSLLYSHPATRWKGIAGADLLVNMAGYGGGTTLAGLLVGRTAFGAAGLGTAGPDGAGWWLTAAFALLFGSFYPLTQLYQVGDDRRRGDRTLAARLGNRRSLALAAVLGLAATACFLMVLARWEDSGNMASWGPVAPLLALGAWLGWIALWFGRAGRMTDREHERGMYRALALWATVDLALILARYSGTLPA